MASRTRLRRATRAQLDAAAAGNLLLQGEAYLIVDEDRFAVGLSSSTYQTYSKSSESASQFDNPYSYTGARPGQGGSFVTYGNIALVNAGSTTTPALSIADSIQRRDRTRYATAGTAGAMASQRAAYVYAKAGSVPGSGGYRYKTCFGLTDLQPGMRAQAGLIATAANATNVDPLAQATPKITLGINSNTGNWNLLTSNGVAPTVINLGTNFPIDTTTWFEWQLTCLPNATEMQSLLTNTATGAQDSRTLSSNLPGQAIQLCPHHWITNNTAAAVAALALGRWDLEFK